MNAASPAQCGAARAVGLLTAASLGRMRIGSTGRWPVGLGGPRKPPTQLPLTIRPRNTRTPRTNLKAVYLCALGVSAVSERCLAYSPQRCACCGPTHRTPLRPMRIGSTGRWPVGLGGPPNPPPQHPASSAQSIAPRKRQTNLSTAYFFALVASVRVGQAVRSSCPGLPRQHQPTNPLHQI